MTAVYKRFHRNRTTYQGIMEMPNREYQIRENITANNPNGSATPNRYDTFRDAERALYKYHPGTKRIA